MVSGVGQSADELLSFEPVDGVRDTRRVDLQPLTDLAEREAATATEEQEHQDLVAGEREPERLQGFVRGGQEDLLDPHHRRHQRHAGRGVVPSVGCPVPARLLNRVEAQVRSGRHGWHTTGVKYHWTSN